MIRRWRELHIEFKVFNIMNSRSFHQVHYNLLQVQALAHLIQGFVKAVSEELQRYQSYKARGDEKYFNWKKNYIGGTYTGPKAASLEAGLENANVSVDIKEGRRPLYSSCQPLNVGYQPKWPAFFLCKLFSCFAIFYVMF